MPYYPAASPAWTLEEEIMLVYFCAKGFEVPDVARIMECRLHRGLRTPRALLRLMERINRVQRQNHLPLLCDPGMLNWDQDAVENHLLNLTDNTNLLQTLLWFHESRYIPLLGTWHDHDVPLDDVLNVGDLRVGLAWLIEEHRRIYAHPFPYEWRHVR